VSHAEALLFHVLLELIVIVAAARAGGWLLGRLGQPQVVGEIAAGLALGPSLLGRLAPELSRYLFFEATEPVFVVLGQLGLVFLMFLVGLEFHFGHLRRLGRTALGVALAGIALPFALGLAVGAAIHPVVASEVPRLHFTLFLATALSITAIPVLGRILMEFGITRTPIGALTLSAAAVDDALGWVLLAAVAATAVGSFHATDALGTIALTIAFAAGVVLVVRPLVARWAARAFAPGARGLTLLPFSILLLGIFASAAITNRIGIFSIFGPFVLGAALWDQERLREAAGARLWDVVNAFFLPIFFTYTGLRTDIGMLGSPRDWAICGLILVAAVAGKMLGTGFMAWRGGMSGRESTAVAVLMNTRALMGLVAINIGRDLGLIPPQVFTMLVVMALVTTFMTSPLLRRLVPPHAAPIAAITDLP
jgi:Kef-type K+ transport system membrane component KefB